VSEALKEMTVVNEETDEIMEGVESSHTKLGRIDQELQDQLQVSFI
jgi:hypothetical protein